MKSSNQSDVREPLELNQLPTASVERLAGVSDAALRLHLGAWLSNEEMEAVILRVGSLRDLVSKGDTRL